MIPASLLVALLITVADDSSIVSRAEQDRLTVNKQVISRIERDGDGNVVRLQLDGMRLSAPEFKELSHLATLRSLSLRGTNVTDADLAQLQSHKKLEYLVLTSTEVSDKAVVELEKFPSLKTVCLGNVAVTPEAIDRLKAAFESKGRRLSLGYFQRKLP